MVITMRSAIKNCAEWYRRKFKIYSGDPFKVIFHFLGKYWKTYWKIFGNIWGIFGKIGQLGNVGQLDPQLSIYSVD